MKWPFGGKPGQPRGNEPAAAPSASATIASGERSIAVDTRGGAFLGNAVTGDNAVIVQVPPGELRPPAQVDAPQGLVNLPARHPTFVGRVRELELLDAALDGAGAAVVQALHGLGGVGKTALAAHWAATRARTDNPVWWITADTPADLDAGLADLAAALQPALAQLPPDQLTERAVQWLATHHGWLLVLDNVDHPGHITPLLARATTGRILVTSRRSSGWHDTASPVPLDVLTPAEALDLLTRILSTRTGDAPDLGGATQLCEELGYLPLAVAQAGAYIAEAGITVRAYLRLLADHPAEMYREAGEGHDSERTIARIWHITLDRLTDTPLAGQILRILAWYAPDDIPRTLLNPLDTPPAVHTAVRRLAVYSMITPDPGAGTLAVHRLVQALARTPDPDDPHRTPNAIAQARTQATELLKTALPGPPEGPGTWPTWRTLLPHVDALFAESAYEDPLPLADALFMNAAIYLIQQSQQHRAVPYLVHALQARARDFGSKHPLTLTMRVALASAYEESGDLAHAIPLFETAFADRRDVLGPDDPKTHTSRVRLASAYEAAGRLDLAIEQLGQALDDAEQVFGRNHPCTLMARSNLAHAFHSAGRLDRAIALYTEGLADHEGVWGGDHPNTLAARNNLAYAHDEAGRPDLAILLYTELIEDMKRVLGPDHPQTLSTGNNLASAYRSLGDLEQARKLYEKAADDRARVLGPDHPDTLTSRSDLTLIYQDVGDRERAIALAKAVLADRRRVLSTDHPDILTSLNILAYCYDAVGATDKAIPLFKEVLRDRTRILGSDNPDTLTARNNLACALAEAGDLDTAIPLLHAILQDRVHVLGRDHPHSITSRGTLGGVYRRAGDFDSALAYYREALADAQRVLGEDHELTVQLQSRLNTQQDW